MNFSIDSKVCFDSMFDSKFCDVVLFEIMIFCEYGNKLYIVLFNTLFIDFSKLVIRLHFRRKVDIKSDFEKLTRSWKIEDSPL